MNNTRIIFYSVLVLSFFNLTGCDKIFPKKTPQAGTPVKTETPALEVKGTIVAKVNNQPIILEDLEAEIESFNEEVPADRPSEKIDTKDKKITYLKNVVIRRMIMAQAASDKGLNRKPEVERALENFKQRLLAAELGRLEAEAVEVTSKEIEDYYNMAKEELKEPEERQLREIVVASEGDAKSIMIELLQGGDFTTLAQSRSITASAKKAETWGLSKKASNPPSLTMWLFLPAWISARPATILRLPRVTLFSGWRPSAEERPKPLLSSGMILKPGLPF